MKAKCLLPEDLLILRSGETALILDVNISKDSQGSFLKIPWLSSHEHSGSSRETWSRLHMSVTDCFFAERIIRQGKVLVMFDEDGNDISD